MTLLDKLKSFLSLIAGWLAFLALAAFWAMTRRGKGPNKNRLEAVKEAAAAEAIKPEVVPDDIEEVKKALAKKGLVKI